MQPLDHLPGFRRRFRITPGEGEGEGEKRVQCEVEDDFHCMSVTVHHDGKTATRIETDMRRVPWTTCPGAEKQLEQTFTGVALARFAERGEKRANCTHLHDLATLAAAHAGDSDTTIYDILVSDPVAGKRCAELRRNGENVLAWVESGFQIVEPEELAGTALDKLRPWIETLDPARQEAARLLQWGNMLANGRVIPLENQSDATRMPPGCYTFQPERKQFAKRVGEIRDFSEGAKQPLDDFKAAF